MRARKAILDEDHLKLAWEGTQAVGEWRQRHPRAGLRLAGADLRQAKLEGADLRNSDLRNADLSRATLSYATLVEASMEGTSLGGASLWHANLGSVEARKSRFEGAELSYSYLGYGDFRSADLTGVTLTGGSIDHARLEGARLSRGQLFGTIIKSSRLDDVDFSGATCGQTVLADCDLSRARALDTIRHIGPSHVTVDTLARTMERAGGQLARAQRTFFENAGVPRTLLDYLPDLLETQPIQFFSCFISYGGHDEEFANRLHWDMKNRGIRCWKYDEDAIIGREVWANISRAITLHEKMIVICSESSLQRPGVQGEIERALQKEEQLLKEKAERGDPDMDTDVLVPVRLDDYVLERWEHPRKADVIKKHIGDFRDWQDEAKYKKAFGHLLRALDPRSKLGLSRLI